MNSMEFDQMSTDRPGARKEKMGAIVSGGSLLGGCFVLWCVHSRTEPCRLWSCMLHTASVPACSFLSPFHFPVATK